MLIKRSQCVPTAKIPCIIQGPWQSVRDLTYIHKKTRRSIIRRTAKISKWNYDEPRATIASFLERRSEAHMVLTGEGTELQLWWTEVDFGRNAWLISTFLFLLFECFPILHRLRFCDCFFLFVGFAFIILSAGFVSIFIRNHCPESVAVLRGWDRGNKAIRR